jgi:hypothetical protein
MAASAALRSLDLDQMLALACRAERGQLASEDGALVAKLLVLLVDIVRLVRATGSSIRTFRSRLFGPSSQEQSRPASDTCIQDAPTNQRVAAAGAS